MINLINYIIIYITWNDSLTRSVTMLQQRVESLLLFKLTALMIFQ